MTQSALEAITYEYLKGLGGTIQEEGNRWHVSLPAHVDVDFTDHHEFEIVLGNEEKEDDRSSNVLSPTSEFTQQVLEETAERAPVGQIALTDRVIDGDYQYPSWLTASDVEVDETTFSPYYDKTAICLFTKVEIETVSEYQTQFLEAVTVDVESKERLPRISGFLLSDFYSPKASPPNGGSEVEEISVASDKLTDAIAVGQELAVDGAGNEIAEIRESASIAANSEFEEYRQFQEQRITELQNKISSLSNRIQTSAVDVDRAQFQQQRIAALEKRRGVKEQKETSENELAEILQKKESGYEWKRSEISERHAIEVRIKPVAFTLVMYERGELKLSLRDATPTPLQIPYTIGIGATGENSCRNCQESLSEDNSICVESAELKCRSCQCHN